MLRVRCVQLFYNPSDPGMEDLLHEVESVRRFVGLRLTEGERRNCPKSGKDDIEGRDLLVGRSEGEERSASHEPGCPP